MTPRPEDVVVFLGPSLPLEDARAILDARYLPPARSGDVLAALRLRPSAIVLIDGLFETTPAPWHKEIVHVLARGVPVLGASSMGALRASELVDFGMTPVGKIATDYVEGALTDDDEVALIHAPGDFAYKPLSEPMVDIRATIEAAVERHGVDRDVADAVTHEAKSMFYMDRSVTGAIARLRGSIDDRRLDALSEVVSGHPVEQKRADAELALRLASGGIDAPVLDEPAWPVYFRKRALQIACSPLPFEVPWLPPREARIIDELRARSDRHLGVILAHLLASAEAVARQVLAEPEEIMSLVAHDGDLGLGRDAGSPGWQAARDLDDDGADAMIRRIARVAAFVREAELVDSELHWADYARALARMYDGYATRPGLRAGDPAALEALPGRTVALLRTASKVWRALHLHANRCGVGVPTPLRGETAENLASRLGVTTHAKKQTWQRANGLDDAGFEALAVLQRELQLVMDNMQLLGTVDVDREAVWISDALALVERTSPSREDADATTLPGPATRAEAQASPGLSPTGTISAAHRFLEERLLPRHPDLLRHLGEARIVDRNAKEVFELFLDVNEHVFCAPVDERRGMAIDGHAAGRVLDFGCGAGHNVMSLARAGHRVTAIDTNETKLEFIKWLGEQQGLSPKIDFQWEGSYDTVVCINTIDHLPDASDLIGQFAETLAPGGKLLLYAHFTNDGVHTSDPRVIARVFGALAQHFSRPDTQTGHDIEVWVRKSPGTTGTPLLTPRDVDDRGLSSMRPRRHPELKVHRDEQGRFVAHGPRWYLRRTQLSPEANRVISVIDGRRAVRDLPEALGQGVFTPALVAEIVRIFGRTGVLPSSRSRDR